MAIVVIVRIGLGYPRLSEPIRINLISSDKSGIGCAVHWVLPVTSDSIGLTRIGSDKSGIGCAVCIGARQRCASVRCVAVRVSAVHWVLPVTSDSIGLTLISSDKY